METNESILTRKVVGIEDRKLLGTVHELRIDCDTLAVSHYVVSSASTNAPLALPFEKALAVGDTFVTIQTRGDFVPASTTEAQAVIRDGYTLLGCEAFTRTGNALGTVKSYEFDPVFGTVTSLTLDNDATFKNDAFVFFSPEFVFVDDGAKTAAELRAAQKAGEPLPVDPVEEAPEPEAENEVAREEPANNEPTFAALAYAIGQPLEEESSDEEAEADDAVEAEEAAAEADEEEAEESAEAEDAEAEAEEATEGAKDEDADVITLLLGATLMDDVVSKDGLFTASKGTTLTNEIIDEAREHDALLLLVMGVED